MAKETVLDNVHTDIPTLLLCPISGCLMIEPVVLFSRKTYDKASIQSLLNQVLGISPGTKQVFSHTILVPDLMLSEMISQWFEDQLLILKGKLLKSFTTIFEGSDLTLHDVEEAISFLSALKELKWGSPLHVPHKFRCPISGHLMTDPVIFLVGQTYDRQCIQKWLNEVQGIYPEMSVFTQCSLTPNLIVQDIISDWCKEHGVELTKPVGDIDGEVSNGNRHHSHSLLDKTLSLFDQKKAAAEEFPLLMTSMPSLGTLVVESEAPQRLLSPLSARTTCIHPRLYEVLITTVQRFSTNDDKEIEFLVNENVITSLTDLWTSGTMETRSSAAAAISSFLTLSSKGIIIEKSAIKHLVKLLEEQPSTMIDIALSIRSKIRNPILVDEFFALLGNLYRHSKAAVQGLDYQIDFLSLMNISMEITSERSQEDCHAILDDQEKIRDDDSSKLSLCGTSRAKRKAICILDIPPAAILTLFMLASAYKILGNH